MVRGAIVRSKRGGCWRRGSSRISRHDGKLLPFNLPRSRQSPLLGDKLDYHDISLTRLVLNASVPRCMAQVSYDAVLEALVLTASGDDAKGEAEMKAKKLEETMTKLHTLSVEELEKQIKRLQDQVNLIEDELMAAS
eukprot:COSAG02_NODE_7075_length_3196_cov_1.760736_2_plen_137_part_00